MEHVTSLLVKPSQWLSIGYVLIPIGALFVFGISWWVLLGILMYGYQYAEIYCWSYEFLDDRVIERKGVFTVTTKEIQYFRIKSVMSVEPLWMRILGLSVINVKASEKFQPEMKLFGIRNGESIMELINGCARDWREIKGVKEFDMYNLNEL